MKFILTRHGEKAQINSPFYKDHFNAGLSDNGVKQIETLGGYLKVKFPDLVDQRYVYCSQMGRSIESAKILKSIINIKELSIRKNLQEYFGTNNYSLPKPERVRLNVITLKNKDYIPQDVGRSLNQAIAEFKSTLEQIVLENSNETILIAGHGLINRYFIYTFSPELEPAPEISLEFGSKAGGYSTVEYLDGKFRLLEYNKLPDFNN